MLRHIVYFLFSIRCCKIEIGRTARDITRDVPLENDVPWSEIFSNVDNTLLFFKSFVEKLFGFIFESPFLLPIISRPHTREKVKCFSKILKYFNKSVF